jgi:hypothetical protein
MMVWRKGAQQKTIQHLQSTNIRRIHIPAVGIVQSLHRRRRRRRVRIRARLIADRIGLTARNTFSFFGVCRRGDGADRLFDSIFLLLHLLLSLERKLLLLLLLLIKVHIIGIVLVEGDRGERKQRNVNGHSRRRNKRQAKRRGVDGRV